jgi:large subunit ribosomal protein L18
MTKPATVMKKIWRRRLRRMKRHKVFGTKHRPRLCIYRSNKHFYSQIINDEDGITICWASTNTKEVRERIKNTSNINAAREVGKKIAEVALSKGIKKVVLDIRWFKYHGRVKAFAEEARKGGLEF